MITTFPLNHPMEINKLNGNKDIFFEIKLISLSKPNVWNSNEVNLEDKMLIYG